MSVSVEGEGQFGGEGKSLFLSYLPIIIEGKVHVNSQAAYVNTNMRVSSSSSTTQHASGMQASSVLSLRSSRGRTGCPLSCQRGGGLIPGFQASTLQCSTITYCFTYAILVKAQLAPYQLQPST